MDIDLSGTRVTNASLAFLHGAADALKKLNLSECKNLVFEEAKEMWFVSALTRLQELDLSSCVGVGSDGLSSLARLPLTHLNLADCVKVADAGLAHLRSLPLTKLNLCHCNQITDAGLAQFSGGVLN